MNHSLPTEDLGHILGKTQALWSGLRNAHFFITGGTGFFGRWILESFEFIENALNLGIHATILTRNRSAFIASAPHLANSRTLAFIEGDMRSVVLPVSNYDYIIHGAAPVSKTSASGTPRQIFESIVYGTQNVLDFASRSDARKLLFISSGAIYGPQPPNMDAIPEHFLGGPDPLDSRSAYGEGKRAAEHLCNLHSDATGLDVTIARCFAFVGPHLPLDGQFAIGNFIRDAINGETLRIKGDGLPLRSYLYAADLAIWLWHLLFLGLPKTAYNVGSDFAISILDLAKTVLSEARSKTPLEILVEQSPLEGTISPRYIPNIDLARTSLKLDVYVSLEQAISKTIRYYSPRSRSISV